MNNNALILSCLFVLHICKSVPPYNTPHSLIKAWNVFYMTGVQLYLHCRDSLLSMFMLESETPLYFNMLPDSYRAFHAFHLPQSTPYPLRGQWIPARAPICPVADIHETFYTRRQMAPLLFQVIQSPFMYFGSPKIVTSHPVQADMV